jgi:mannosyltransferase
MNTKIRDFFMRSGWSIPVIVGLLLRLFEITKSSIWHDEGYTMWLLGYNVKDILLRTARDVHPPGYYLIAKPWVALFGNSVFSIRFLSLLFSVGIIYLIYRIIDKLWDKKAAYWSAMFVAFSPFLIRFGQEARMYGVVAFFTTLATYYFINFVKEKKQVYLMGYTLSMIIAMYTQYYSFFVIISLWLIYILLTPDVWKFHWVRGIKDSSGVLNWRWWLANVTLLVLYLPWFPIAYKQVTRVSSSYWIKPEWITIKTIPANVSQFVTYTHMDALYGWHGLIGATIYWLIVAVLVGSGLILLKVKDKRNLIFSLYIFGYLPMLLVFILSKLRTPIYQDRYFPFSAIAIFAIWGCTVALINNKKLRIVVATGLMSVMIFGILVMHTEVNHQMKQVTDEITKTQNQGDIITSGSLYTFLDGSYYLGYGELKFISKTVDGYGETSLFYDQADKYIVNPNRMTTLGNRIWVLGKPGEDYISGTPLKYWHQTTVIEKGSVRAVLYTK